MAMPIAFITLAVKDLKRSISFYVKEVGLDASNIVVKTFHGSNSGAAGTIGSLTPQGCPTIGLYERHHLARDADVPMGTQSRTEFSLGIALPSCEAVDDLLARIALAGSSATPSCQDRP
ncbi:MAG: VOC family protein [Candidatus Dormibacteria bacterium]